MNKDYIKITRASNGYVVDHFNGVETETVVFEDADEFDAQQFNKGQVESCADLLRHIQDCIGPSSGRYDKKRVYVVVKPGDKNDAFTEADAEEIWGGSEDTQIQQEEQAVEAGKMSTSDSV